MAILFNRFSQVRLLLVTLWVVGFTLGAAPLGYAQDIPTPTPPADGGNFDGAPDPTPGPEVTPELPPDESVTPPSEASEVSEPSSPQIDGTDPAGDVPASDELGGAGGEFSGDPADVESSPTEVLPGAVGSEQSPAPMPAASPAPGGPTEMTDPPVTDGPASGAAPANNSPRGLW